MSHRYRHPLIKSAMLTDGGALTVNVLVADAGKPACHISIQFAAGGTHFIEDDPEVIRRIGKALLDAAVVMEGEAAAKTAGHLDENDNRNLAALRARGEKGGAL